jgi:valyl-tRNA synthetase
MSQGKELPKQFDPKEAQQKWLALWTERGYFHNRPDPNRTPYTIVIPPPNVTGALHMGHALNNTLQDVLIRWRRMQGFNAEWMPGTDHAGIATQAVVEKLIFQTEKKTRRDLGREELVRRIWEWKDKYEARILGQLRELGCSCDWPRTRFTMDEGYSRAVRTTFFNWFRDGYIFRGKRLVNWDTQLQTSVADDETYTEEVPSHFWTFKFPVKNSKEFIRFSTTRPETMLGDTAVCVHPDDERYKHLIGKSVTIPLNGREIPIIADGLLADPTLGTGAVKVTPGHDHNDFACYQRHPEIGIINILNPDGTINENGAPFSGMDRYAAREAATAKMEELGFFEGREDRVIPLAFSDRSKTPIEPYLSDQWFVKMGDREDGKPGLARMAIEAVLDERVKFFPDRYKNTYLDWLSEKRDWCISRQLWWGHRIPVWQVTIRANLYQQELGGIRASRKRVELEFRKAVNAFAQACKIDQELAVASSETSEAIFFVCAGSVRAENEINAFYRRHHRARNVPMGSPDVPSEPHLTQDDPRREADGQLWALIAEMRDQDSDVLDTWFSSQLWPHATFGWPERTPELAYYYPGSTLVTARDIITLWVVRMVMSGLYNMGEVPFRHVYVTPNLLDAFGVRMSKSKGNGVDPLDIIENYGADALRYQMVFLAGETQDCRLPVSNICPFCGTFMPLTKQNMDPDIEKRPKKATCPNCKKQFRPGGPWPTDDPNLPTAKQASKDFEMGRNFANKLWNAARFVLQNLEGYRPEAIRTEQLPIEDRWILSRLQTTAKRVTELLEGYHFSDVARTIYDFTWSEFCDWYVEMSKGRLKDEASRPLAQRMLVGVLDAILRLIHPVMPFVTESIWQALNEAAFERGLPTPDPSADSVMIAPWPKFPEAWHDPAMEQRISRTQDLVRAVREIRNNFMVNDREQVQISVRCAAGMAADFQALRPFIGQLAGVGTLECGPDVAKPRQAASKVMGGFDLYVSLAGLIDVAKEKSRLEKQLGEKRKLVQTKQAKLSNESFVSRAPAEVVQQEREAVDTLQCEITTLEENLRDLTTE